MKIVVGNLQCTGMNHVPYVQQKMDWRLRNNSTPTSDHQQRLVLENIPLTIHSHITCHQEVQEKPNVLRNSGYM
jgi:hypothetical protein